MHTTFSNRVPKTQMKYGVEKKSRKTMDDNFILKDRGRVWYGFMHFKKHSLLKNVIFTNNLSPVPETNPHNLSCKLSNSSGCRYIFLWCCITQANQRTLSCRNRIQLKSNKRIQMYLLRTSKSDWMIN